MTLWQGKKVIVVEDCEVIREHLIELYQSIGMSVVGSCSNGVEAISLCETHNPDLLSLDIIMPEMNGIDCYRAIQPNFPHLKFVFVSVLSQDLTIVSKLSTEIPSHLFMTKPLNPDMLKERLNIILTTPAIAQSNSTAPSAIPSLPTHKSVS